MNATFKSRPLIRAALPTLVVALTAGCNGVAGGGRALTPLDEVPGLQRSALAGLLAEEGLSVGDLRTAVLPDGLTVAILTPQPSDGYTAQVTVVRLDDGVPNTATETVCDPFLWTTDIDSTRFGGLDPARIVAVAWEDWVGNGRPDLVVDFTMSATANDQYTGSFDAGFRARCAFRPTDDRGSGRVTPAVFGWLAEATSNSTYSDTSTEIIERHEVLPVAGEPDQFDYRIATEVHSCHPGPQGPAVCVPRTVITIQRYAVVDAGLRLAYVPLEEAAYHYPTPDYGYYTGLTGTMCDDPQGCDDTTDDYYDTAGGYDDTAGGYDDNAGGYDDTAGGYDDNAGGYDEEAVPD